MSHVIHVIHTIQDQIRTFYYQKKKIKTTSLKRNYWFLLKKGVDIVFVYAMFQMLGLEHCYIYCLILFGQYSYGRIW